MNRDLENVLILDGEQETDIWVNAEAITNFRILFYRKESFFWSIDSNFLSDTIKMTMFELLAEESRSFSKVRLKLLKSDNVVTDSGVNMEIQCRPRDLSTHDVFEIYRNRLEGETTAVPGTIEYVSETGYTIWSEWGLCTVKCGSGTKQRSRVHSNGNEETEEISCNTSPCGKLKSSC